MQNKTWSKRRESKIERQMEEGREMRSLLYFFFLFPIGSEASRCGFLTTWVPHPLPKHDVGAGCQLLKHPSLVAPAQMTVLSVSLHSVYRL